MSAVSLFLAERPGLKATSRTGL